MEIENLSRKGVIEKAIHHPQQFVSNIFPRPKKDGGCRVILDLTHLNSSVLYRHFKMDTFVTAKQLVSQGCYMATIDCKMHIIQCQFMLIIAGI